MARRRRHPESGWVGCSRTGRSKEWRSGSKYPWRLSHSEHVSPCILTSHNIVCCQYSIRDGAFSYMVSTGSDGFRSHSLVASTLSNEQSGPRPCLALCFRALIFLVGVGIAIDLAECWLGEPSERYMVSGVPLQEP